MLIITEYGVLLLLGAVELNNSRGHLEILVQRLRHLELLWDNVLGQYVWQEMYLSWKRSTCYHNRRRFTFWSANTKPLLLRSYLVVVVQDVVNDTILTADNDGDGSKPNVTQQIPPRVRHEANRRDPLKVKGKKHVVWVKVESKPSFRGTAYGKLGTSGQRGSHWD
jgi:hypothetical protein